MGGGGVSQQEQCGPPHLLAHAHQPLVFLVAVVGVYGEGVGGGRGGVGGFCRI